MQERKGMWENRAVAIVTFGFDTETGKTLVKLLRKMGIGKREIYDLRDDLRDPKQTESWVKFQVGGTHERDHRRRSRRWHERAAREHERHWPSGSEQRGLSKRLAEGGTIRTANEVLESEHRRVTLREEHVEVVGGVRGVRVDRDRRRFVERHADSRRDRLRHGVGEAQHLAGSAH